MSPVSYQLLYPAMWRKITTFFRDFKREVKSIVKYERRIPDRKTKFDVVLWNEDDQNKKCGMLPRKPLTAFELFSQRLFFSLRPWLLDDLDTISAHYYNKYAVNYS
jgi:hypothetical protein